MMRRMNIFSMRVAENVRNGNQSKTPLLFRATAVGCCLLGKEMTCCAEFGAGAELWSAKFLNEQNHEKLKKLYKKGKIKNSHL